MTKKCLPFLVILAATIVSAFFHLSAWALDKCEYDFPRNPKAKQSYFDVKYLKPGAVRNTMIPDYQTKLFKGDETSGLLMYLQSIDGRFCLVDWREVEHLIEQDQYFTIIGDKDSKKLLHENLLALIENQKKAEERSQKSIPPTGSKLPVATSFQFRAKPTCRASLGGFLEMGGYNPEDATISVTYHRSNFGDDHGSDECSDGTNAQLQASFVIDQVKTLNAYRTVCNAKLDEEQGKSVAGNEVVNGAANVDKVVRSMTATGMWGENLLRSPNSHPECEGAIPVSVADTDTQNPIVLLDSGKGQKRIKISNSAVTQVVELQDNGKFDGPTVTAPAK